MTRPLFRITTVLLAASTVLAAPSYISPRSSGTFTTISAAQFNRFKPFTSFASAAYCSPSKTKNWSCGANCEANPKFIPTATGGDGVTVQFWYVGFDPDLHTVIVAHQGTDPSKIVPLLEDADFAQENLNASLFPGVSSDIKVHNGFRDAQADTAQDVLAAVQKTMQAHSTKNITVVGHSLGGAISMLDAVFLPLHIPGVELQMISYGQPRVGNQDFANFVDSKVHFTRITNKKDLVPILPGRFLGFQHGSNEIHIESSDGSFVACPGQDNPDARCSTGDAKNIFEASIPDHFGPYGGVKIGC